jgi:hypothetical protein
MNSHILHLGMEFSKHFFLLCLASILITGCTKENSPDTRDEQALPSSLSEAVVSLRFGYRESDLSRMGAFAYYTYIHKREAIKSLQLVDSIRVEGLWLLFYKYSINGRDYQHADWFLNIKGKYFYAGVYISEYNTSELFEAENVELVKALLKKANTWEDRSEKRWWKYIE